VGEPGRSSPETASSADGFVPSLGLPSAIALVVGSMIGSGIFIVPADIARLTRSPALFIATWLVTAFLTVSGALAYGELAAMLPKAGGQYVFLREAFGPLAGFLYGWTLFCVIQTGTIAAVGVAFAKFVGHFWPGVAGDRWLWHVAELPRLELGPVALGGYSVGLSTQNLVAILVVWLLTLVNARGVAFGALVQNAFTVTKTAALGLLVVVGVALARSDTAIADNFGSFWRGCDFSARFSVECAGQAVEVGVIAVVGMAQVGSLFSADAWNNVTFAAAEVKNPRRGLPLALALGTGLVLVLYVAANLAYLCVLPLGGDPAGATPWARGIAHASGDRVGSADDGGRVRPERSRADGGSGAGVDLRLCQRADPVRRARLLGHGARRPVLSPHRDPPPDVEDAGTLSRRPGRLELGALPVGILRAIARLRRLRGAHLLRGHHRRTFRAARAATEHGPAVSCPWLPRLAGPVRAGSARRRGSAPGIQARVDVARARLGGDRSAGVFRVAPFRQPADKLVVERARARQASLPQIAAPGDLHTLITS
jgi:hypothetical protein